MLRLVQLDTCESTNDEAWKLMPETALVTTRRQSRGRGRQGRSWLDSAENVMMSLGCVPEAGLSERLSWVPLAAGVACIEALGLVAPLANSGLRLKWPNDVMWDDAKMGGILCESRFKGSTSSGLVIGVGLNLGTAPEVAETATTSLSRHVPALAEKDRLEDARRRFIQAWTERIFFWMGELSADRIQGLRNAWLSAARLDRFDRYGVNRAVDLDERGRLVVKTPTGELAHLDQPVQ